MKIVFLNGSPRKNGTTAKIFDLLKNELAGHEFFDIFADECVMSSAHPFCRACSNPCNKSCYSGTMLENAFETITQSDFVVIGSPTYFGAVTAQLKAFFDKTRDIRGKALWLGKPVAAVTSGGSKYGGQQAAVRDIHEMALVQGMTIVGDSGAGSVGHFGVSTHRDVIDDYTQQRIKALAARILTFDRQQ